MKKHGMRDSPEYKAWSEAKQRCHNSNSAKFKWYGARGIAVCDAWRDDFPAFFEHIGAKPAGSELDRIDNDKGYQPGNVRWATKVANVRNRRNSLTVAYRGVTMTLDEYALAAGINYQTAWARMKKAPHLIAGESRRLPPQNLPRIEAKVL